MTDAKDEKAARIDLDGMKWRGGERRQGVDMAPPADFNAWFFVIWALVVLLVASFLFRPNTSPPACVVQGAEQHSTD